MKTMLIIFSALTAALHAQSAGPYTLDWSTTEGGGVTLGSTGGGYTLSGTVGQADSGPLLSGGRFDITGGFWSFLTVVSVPDAPALTLNVISGGTRALLSWDVNTAGWQVEVSTDLQTWQPAAAQVRDTPDYHTITLPAVQRQFFRMGRIPQ